MPRVFGGSTSHELSGFSDSCVRSRRGLIQDQLAVARESRRPRERRITGASVAWMRVMQTNSMKMMIMALAAFGCHAEAASGHDAPVAPAKPVTPVTACWSDNTCVRGDQAADHAVFRGIPYAAPPVGVLRWMPPAPAAAWTGTRDALAFGKACPQLDSPLTGKLAQDEDCLTLNVWTPHVDPVAKLPVMVWLHGGGLVQGGSMLPTYDGSKLASSGSVVVVSINYRLGPLGFLAHPAFAAESTDHAAGDYGLLDQIAALHWIRDHVTAFGGDPSSITIFGESGGGESVCALMASPLATGLFARAVIESAQCVEPGQALRALNEVRGHAKESAEDQGRRIAHQLGCDGDGKAAAACLRGKSVADLLAASPATAGLFGKGEQYGLAIDGHALTEAPADAVRDGHLAAVPLMIGTTADEATLFTTKLPTRGRFGYELVVRKIFAAAATDILAQYPAGSAAKQALDRLVTDLVFACPSRRLARSLRGRQKVYQYEFAHAVAALRDNGLGATHGSEISFVFGTVQTPTADEEALSKAMLGFWSQFAHAGDPNRPGQPAWPSSNRDDAYLELDTTIGARSNLHGPGCDVLDRVTQHDFGNVVAP